MESVVEEAMEAPKVFEMQEAKYTFVPVVFVSFVFFNSIYHYVCPKLSPAFWPGYSALPLGKRVEWDSR